MRRVVRGVVDVPEPVDLLKCDDRRRRPLQIREHAGRAISGDALLKPAITGRLQKNREALAPRPSRMRPHEKPKM